MRETRREFANFRGRGCIMVVWGLLPCQMLTWARWRVAATWTPSPRCSNGAGRRCTRPRWDCSGTAPTHSMPYKTRSLSPSCGWLTCVMPERPGHGCMPSSATSASCRSGSAARSRPRSSSWRMRCPGPKRRSNSTLWASGYGTRCTSYDAIARVTSVPVGTVRSRLSRARRKLADALMASAAGTPMSHAGIEAAQRKQWEEFYRLVHEQPVARTYQELFAPDVDVRDPAGRWHGIKAWSAEEREAITLGVRAALVGVLASRNITVLEIDFSNPATWPVHCPPHATFVHRLSDGRSRQLRIHYPAPTRSPTM